MNSKQNALEDVRVAAELYYNDVEQANASRARLIGRVYAAREASATQQEIADATTLDEKHKLSRQRISQFLQGR
jgi:hypothetical protein